MASISKMKTTKDGKRYWLIQVRKGRDCSPYSMRFQWPEGKKGPLSEKVALRELEKAAAEFERQVKSGEYKNNAEKKEQAAAEQAELAKLKTVKQYAENVFMPTKKITVTENTRKYYQLFIDYIVAEIGDSLLIDVTPAMLTKLLLDYQKLDHSHSTCIGLYNTLNGLFEMAFLDDSIPISPMLKVKRPVQSKDKIGKPEAEKALTPEQANYVFSCIDAEYKEALDNFNRGNDKNRRGIYSAMLWKVYIELSADTGCRRGELVGLKWSDIDFEKMTVTISRNLQYSPQKGVYETATKTGKERVVDIGPNTKALLKEFQEEQSAHRLSPWVFSQEGTNEPIHPQSPTRFFTKFGERHNIQNFHPHLLRHTAASVAITHGADITSVAQRLGHSDPATTLRMYSHATEESIRQAGNAARAAFEAAAKKESAAAQ